MSNPIPADSREFWACEDCGYLGQDATARRCERCGCEDIAFFDNYMDASIYGQEREDANRT